MKVQETVTVERDVHVAPCLECGHTDILLSDSGYSSFNVGSGKCKKCGHEASGSVSCIPKVDDLARIWNANNDIPTLIKAEEAKIAAAEKRIAALKVKAGPSIHLKPREPDDSGDLMPVDEYLRDQQGYGCDDGSGYWATATHISDISLNQPRPDWATHVVWYNR